jgi:outer membrane immunogenic protein
MKISLKALFLSTASSVALAGGDAISAENVPPSTAMFAGPYAGVNIGAARYKWSFTDVSGGGSCFPTCPSQTFWDGKKNGLTGGLQAGYNWQQDRFVSGVEADFNWLRVRRSDTLGTDLAVFSAVDWLSTIRVRAGITGSPTLFYVTGGLAIGRVNNGWSVPGKGAALRKTKTGWTAGIGIEHLFKPNWIGRIELRHTDLGKSTVATTGPSACCSGATRFENTVTEIRGALNYKW